MHALSEIDLNCSARSSNSRGVQLTGFVFDGLTLGFALVAVTPCLIVDLCPGLQNGKDRQQR